MATILIVDDEEMIRSMLQQALTKDGHDIFIANNGKEAIETAQQQPLDLLITDLVMPVQNGLDLIMEIRKNHPDIPIVAISGGGGLESHFNYLSVAELIGAHSIFKKPLELSEFRRKIDELLARKSSK